MVALITMVELANAEAEAEVMAWRTGTIVSHLHSQGCRQSSFVMVGRREVLMGKSSTFFPSLRNTSENFGTLGARHHKLSRKRKMFRTRTWTSPLPLLFVIL